MNSSKQQVSERLDRQALLGATQLRVLLRWTARAHNEAFLAHDSRSRRFAQPMLRLGTSIRLTRAEATMFTRITDFEPVGIRTLVDLEFYVAACKHHYRGRSYASQFLCWLIDQQMERCLGLRERQPWTS